MQAGRHCDLETVREQWPLGRWWELPVTHRQADPRFTCTWLQTDAMQGREGRRFHCMVKLAFHGCVWSSRTTGQPHGLCSVVRSVAGALVQVTAMPASTESASKCTHLAGFGVHIPTGEELFHNLHVLLCFHGSKGCQHDGGVPCLILVIHVTHICKNMSLLRQEPVFQQHQLPS